MLNFYIILINNIIEKSVCHYQKYTDYMNDNNNNYYYHNS